MSSAPGPMLGEREPYAAYQAQLAQGNIAFQRCASCDRAVFYSRVICPHCGSDRLAWQASDGHGTIYSVTTVSSRDGSDHLVCLVDLDEGFRMMSTVVDGAPATVSIGDRVVGRTDAIPSVDEESVFRIVFEKRSDEDGK